MELENPLKIPHNIILQYLQLEYRGGIRRYKLLQAGMFVAQKVIIVLIARSMMQFFDIADGGNPDCPENVLDLISGIADKDRCFRMNF